MVSLSSLQIEESKEEYIKQKNKKIDSSNFLSCKHNMGSKLNQL
jgi:hypothetical protein